MSRRRPFSRRSRLKADTLLAGSPCSFVASADLQALQALSNSIPTSALLKRYSGLWNQREALIWVRGTSRIWVVYRNRAESLQAFVENPCRIALQPCRSDRALVERGGGRPPVIVGHVIDEMIHRLLADAADGTGHVLVHGWEWLSIQRRTPAHGRDDRDLDR